MNRFIKYLALKIIDLLRWCVEHWNPDPKPPPEPKPWVDEPEDWRDDGGG